MTSRKLTVRIKGVTPLATGFLKVNRYELESRESMPAACTAPRGN